MYSNLHLLRSMTVALEEGWPVLKEAMYCHVTISVHLKSEIFEKNEKQNKLTTVKQFQNLIWKIIETGKIYIFNTDVYDH